MHGFRWALAVALALELLLARWIGLAGAEALEHVYGWAGNIDGRAFDDGDDEVAAGNGSDGGDGCDDDDDDNGKWPRGDDGAGLASAIVVGVVWLWLGIL